MTDIGTCGDDMLSRLTRPRRMLLTIALAVIGALAMTTAPQAQAQPPKPANCPTNRICLYEYDNYAGPNGRVPSAIYAVGSKDMNRYGPRFDNKASSIHNNSAYTWCGYRDANYNGPFLVINPWEDYWRLTAWDNAISSIRKC